MSFEIGTRLKKARTSRNKTVADLANLLNISDRTYRYYEQNERDISTLTLKTICEFLNVSSAYILGMSDDMEISNDSESTISAKEVSKNDVNKQRILALFDKLDPIQQENIIAKAELFVELNKEYKEEGSG